MFIQTPYNTTQPSGLRDEMTGRHIPTYTFTSITPHI